MVKMVSLAKTAAEKKAETAAGGEERGMPTMNEPEGIDIHLSHEHMKKLGMDEPLPVGHKITLHGDGEVTHASSDDDAGMGKRNRMTIKVKKAAVEHDEPQTEKGDGLRRQLEEEHGKSAAKQEERAAEKTAKREKGGAKADSDEVY